MSRASSGRICHLLIGDKRVPFPFYIKWNYPFCLCTEPKRSYLKECPISHQTVFFYLPISRVLRTSGTKGELNFLLFPEYGGLLFQQRPSQDKKRLDILEGSPIAVLPRQVLRRLLFRKVTLGAEADEICHRHNAIFNSLVKKFFWHSISASL